MVVLVLAAPLTISKVLAAVLALAAPLGCSICHGWGGSGIGGYTDNIGLPPIGSSGTGGSGVGGTTTIIGSPGTGGNSVGKGGAP